MTFAAREESRALGAPIALFLFTFGDGAADYYAYTSAETEITFNTIVYSPVAVSNDAVSTTGTLDKASIDLRLSKELEVARLYDGYPPSRHVTLKIFIGHVGESEFKANWSGRILSFKIEDEEAVFTCEPVSSALRRSGLRGTYSYGCRHVLYGTKCLAAEAAFSVLGVVSVIDSPYLTLVGGWSGAFDANKFVHGRASWINRAGRTEKRTIVRLDTADQMVLGGDFDTLQVGDTVTLSLGCDHDLDGDCVNTFNNAPNFGGHKWIPLKNPLGSFNNFV